MNTCLINDSKLLEITKSTELLIEDYLNDDEATSDSLNNNIKKLINTLKGTLQISSDKEIFEIAKAITKGADNMKFDDNEIFGEGVLVKNLKYVYTEGELNLSEQTQQENVLKDYDEAEDEIKSSSRFLRLAYGAEVEVEKAARREVDRYLFDSLFVNRGSLPGRQGIVRNNDELNRNIKAYLSHLLRTICNYLSTKPELLTDEEKELVEKPVLFNRDNGSVTNILDKLWPVIQRYLSPNKFKNKLTRLLNESKTNSESKLLLDAINAAIFLKNFDKYLKVRLPDVIEIRANYEGEITGRIDKYKIADSTAVVNKTWRTSENFDAAEEMDGVTKLLVDTTKILKFGTDSETGLYLNFQLYQNAVGKLKALGLSGMAYNIKFNNDFKINPETREIWNSFSEDLKNFIENILPPHARTLAGVINYMRKNDRAYSRFMFEIISNPLFKNTYKDIYNNFLKEELNHLYTIHKAFFDYNTDTSFYNLVGKVPEIDYFQYLTQSTNCIFLNIFIQQYRDSDGNIKARVLNDMNKYGKRVRLKGSINSRNLNDIPFTKEYKFLYDDQKHIIKFDIPNNILQTIATITIDLNDNWNVSIDIPPHIKVNNTAIESFINETLGLRVGKDPDFLITYAQGDVDKEESSLKELLELASRVHAARYISLKYINNKTESEALALAKLHFVADVNYNFNRNTGQIDVLFNVGNNSSVIESIINTQAILEGNTTSTQVKNSEQASLNQQTLSRLIGAVGSLIDIIERDPNSISKDFTLLTTPGLFLGHYSLAEFYDQRTNQGKDALTMSVSEMAYGTIMTQFLPAFLSETDENKYDLIKNGIATFIASVNSDKGTIGNISFDLKAKVPVLDENGNYQYDKNGLIIKDKIGALNYQQINLLIKKDFGTFYTGMLNNIINDLTKVDTIIKDFISNYFPSVDISTIPSLNYLNNFEEFNNWVNNVLTKSGFPNITPVKLIKDATTWYNTHNRKNPIELIDNLHFKGSKNLENNEVIIAQVARFNPTAQITKYNTSLNNLVDTSMYPSLDEFMYQKEKEFAYDALTSATEFDLSKGGIQVAIIESRPEWKEWVDKSENISISKFTYKGRTFVSKIPENLQELAREETIALNLGKSKDEWVYVRPSDILQQSIVEYSSKRNNNKKLAICKIVLNGNTYYAADIIDLLKITIKTGYSVDEIFENATSVELNPMLLKYNQLGFWLTQQWMNITVGSFVAHSDSKFKLYEGKSELNKIRQLEEEANKLIENGESPFSDLIQAIKYEIEELRKQIYKRNVIRREAAMFLALHKRNVSMTAQMHLFSLNTLKGVNEDYTIAVIDDAFDFRPILSATNQKMKPYDGATFVDPFTNYLENYSLGGAKVGLQNKKQFVHFKTATTGTAGIIKTAGFAITNDRMRNCKKNEGWNLMMRKMTDITWVDENGNPLDIDITKGIYDRRNPNRTLNDPQWKDNYIFQDGKYYKIKGFLKIGVNTYRRILQEVDIKGNYLNDEFVEDTKLVIDTNYKLWQAFGGAYSFSKSLETEALVPSEVSILNVVETMNSVGYTKEGYKLTQVETQDLVYQPLKLATINYLVTAGAIKQNAANINSIDRLNPGDNVPLNIQRIKLTQAGILLDKEHHADNATLSLPTLIISAAAALGYTYDLANNLYQSLADSARIGIRLLLNDVLAYLNNPVDREKLQNSVLELIARELSEGKSDVDSFALLIADKIIEEVESGSKSSFKEAGFPLSDGTIYRKLISTLSSYISKKAIKLQISGLLCVLTPSHNLFKIYGTRKYDSLYNWSEDDIDLVKQYTSILNPEQLERFNKLEKQELLLEALQWESDSKPLFEKSIIDGQTSIKNDLHKVDLGRKYRIRRLYVAEYIPGMKEFAGLKIKQVNFGELISPEDNRPVGMRNPGDGTILVDEVLMRQKFEEKAWRNTRNSEPLNYDFNTFEEFMAFALTYEAMHSKFKIHKGESKFNYETRINNEALKVITGNQIIEFNEIKYLNTPEDLRNVRELANKGHLSRLSEYVIDGRNLSGYNARFLTEEGESYLLYDLDSVYYVHQLDKIKLIKDPLKKGRAFTEWILDTYKNSEPPRDASIESMLKYWRNLVQIDIETLSLNVDDPGDRLQQIYDEYNNLISIWNSIPDGREKTLAYNDIIKTRNKYQRYLEAHNQLTQIDFDNYQAFAVIHERLKQGLKANNYVVINGKQVHPIKSTIDILAYELIMPKTFKEEFGFDEHTDLNEVLKDPLWFLKHSIEKLLSKLTSNMYDIELKRMNGDHVYIIEKSHLPSDNIVDITSTINESRQNGKRIRKNGSGEIMYEMTEGTKVYKTLVNGEPIEILVVDSIDDIDFYVSNIGFDYINFSQNLKNYGDYIENLISNKLENNKRIGNFIRTYITEDSDKIDTDSLWKNIDRNIITNLTINNYKGELERYQREWKKPHPLVSISRKKHSSFLKSLEVVVARIPSLSMQSFMPMKVVAYDNPNKNSAYVSSLQLLLQGSDFDIDSASIVTYNIDKSGNMLLWSPYSVLDNIEMLNKSMKLPFPTGLDIQTIETDSDVRLDLFMQKYGTLFDVNVFDNGSIKVNLRYRDDLTKMDLLALLLQEKLLYIPSKNAIPKLIKKFNLTAEQIQTLYTKIAEFINKHNHYLTNTSDYVLKRIQNNYTVSMLHNVISDVVNLTQAQAPIDAITDPLKYEADLRASESAYDRSAGNEFNKFFSIFENQEAKECIGISAVGIKGFFMAFQMANSILNDENYEDLSSAIFSNAASNTALLRRKIANIKAKDPYTITNPELRSLLLNAKTEEDLALVLSALLSLAVDNAKELSLSKLNAGGTMIPLYIYGITIGMDFKDLAKILTSDTAKIIKSLTDTNVMTEDHGYSKILKAFDYFEKEPYKIYAYKYLEGNVMLLSPDSKSPLEFLESLVLRDIGEDLDLRHPKHWTLRLLEKYPNLSDLYIYLDGLRGKYNVDNSINDIRYNQLIDFILSWAYQRQLLDSNDLDKLKDLARGAEEMFVTGQIAGLNLGIPTTIDGILNKISYIENALEEYPDAELRQRHEFKRNHTEEEFKEKYGDEELYGKDGFKKLPVERINLQKFAFDEDYRKEMIKKCELCKYSINNLQLIDRIPHILGYVLALAVLDESLKLSWRYRNTRSMLYDAKDFYEQSTDDIIRGLDNYLGNYTINHWLRDFAPSKYSEFIIPAGNKIFKRNGELDLTPLQEDLKIKLGDDTSNAIFRRWVETLVIPNLKNGIISPNSSNGSGNAVSENKFIIDLALDENTWSVSGNSVITYTLSGMMPRTELEKVIFDEYKNEFNKLRDYNYSYMTKDRVVSIPIRDIFYLYAMIAQDGKISERSLMPLFTDMQFEGPLGNYHDYITQLDDKGPLLDFRLLKSDKSFDAYMASKRGPHSSSSEKTWGYNKNRKRRELMKRGRGYITDNYEDGERRREAGLGNYKWLLSDENLLPNYFPKMTVDNRLYHYIRHLFKLADGQDVDVSILKDTETDNNHIVYTVRGKATLQLKNYNPEMILTVENGIITPYSEYIEAKILEDLNYKFNKTDEQSDTYCPPPF